MIHVAFDLDRSFDMISEQKNGCEMEVHTKMRYDSAHYI
jgi:hypothetical protein